MAHKENMDARNRVIIENFQPVVDGGRYYAKSSIGQLINCSADVFADGHDVINASLLYKHEKQKTFNEIQLTNTEQDCWETRFKAEKQGFYQIKIIGWIDNALNWQHNIQRKIADKQHVNVELLDGIQYLDFANKKATKTEKTYLSQLKKLFQSDKNYNTAIAKAIEANLIAIFHKYPHKEFITETETRNVYVDRKKALFSSWYEFFPRSSSGTTKHGTFKDCIKILPEVAKMGFDVLYFPPIHPIGESFRKGKNNTTTALKGDAGSPWAIGSKEGGHKDIHPELGTLADFKKLVAEAKKLDIEIALDYALQCAPDHPYVKEYPQWFKWRPDGTVQYAENPPKKYQDILPINFETKDWKNLWDELKSIIDYWVAQGITIFRVDNPHTKAFPFWEWMINEVKKANPDVLFLAEAFTRPSVMHNLAKLGFSQSYTYFTWRNTKAELSEYMNEITQDKGKNYFRPNFWPNTPDINPYQLQSGNENMFLIRYFLAATLSSNYGMYGPVYEQIVHQAIPGKEEYLSSEKYEVKDWDFSKTNKLKELIKIINQFRKENAALQDTYNFQELKIENENLFCYFKYNQEEDNYLLMAVNLDPYNQQGGWVQLPLKALNHQNGNRYLMQDILTSNSYYWESEWNFIELNPHVLPFHLFKITKQ